VPDLQIGGHDPALLANNLEYLRRRRYSLMSAMELIRHLDEGIPLRENALVFTIDDGYADFAAAGAPVFAAYDCPVTVFLVTDFVSGRLWNWFDRLTWAFRNSARRDVKLDFGGESVHWRWTNPAEAERAADQLAQRLKKVADVLKEQLIDRVAGALEVDIPDRPTEQYRAMNWDEVRACGRQGVTFGPHTVSHPILSQIDATRSDREISESWRAVAAATDAAVPIFCYPNGTSADFSSREKASIARSGMIAAFSTMKGFLESSASGIAPTDRFAMPRIAYAEQKLTFVQIASGIEALKVRMTKRTGSG
jgi:peptidoglycan/xylan/chitin deacetylase (PgdA/CDA1 family)